MCVCVFIYQISPHHCYGSHGDTEMTVSVPAHSGNCLIRTMKHTCKYLRAQAENKLLRRREQSDSRIIASRWKRVVSQREFRELS